MQKKVVMVLRIILGIALVVFGLNGFFNFMPMDFPQPLANFMAALMGAGYLIPLAKLLEILVGVSLIVNRYTLVSLLALLPLSVNFVLIHLFLDVANIVPALVIFVLNVFLLWVNWKYYKPLFKHKSM